MSTSLKKRDWIGFSAATVFLLGVVSVGRMVIGDVATGVGVILGVSLILLLLLQRRREALRAQERAKRETKNALENTFEQTEALLGLYSGLENTTAPLPRTNGWAASPDYLLTVYKQIRKRKPGLVVELGSGASTIVAGHALRQNESGSLVSLEHLHKYAHQTRGEISLHALGDHCRVLESPLESYSLKGGEWKWYSLDKFEPGESIGLVIVDGPPGYIQDLSRYPAFPLLSKHLSEEAVFIIDDGDRKDEKT